MIDTPPGTSDEHMSIVQFLKGTNLDGAVIVTTPQVNHMLQYSCYVSLLVLIYIVKPSLLNLVQFLTYFITKYNAEKCFNT